MPLDDVWADDDCAVGQLRWGGDGIDDEDLWQALLGALDEASNDDELWFLGDGFIPESICPREALDRRLEKLEQTDERMQRVIHLVETQSYGDPGPWRPVPADEQWGRRRNRRGVTANDAEPAFWGAVNLELCDPPLMPDDVHAEKDESGWTFRFDDSLVTQLLVDYRFSRLLGGGALVVLEGPFELQRGGRTVRVPPGDAVFEVAEALPLFNCRIDSVRAASSGELRIDFGEDGVATVPVNPHYENWQIVMPSGKQWVGVPGGGVQHISGS